MAMNEYGYRRVTEDVDVLLTREGLDRFKQHWLGRAAFATPKTGYRSTSSPAMIRGTVVPSPWCFPIRLAPHRLRDLADVLELIRVADLPLEMAVDLDESVREKYRELWHAAHSGRDDE